MSRCVRTLRRSSIKKLKEFFLGLTKEGITQFNPQVAYKALLKNGVASFLLDNLLAHFTGNGIESDAVKNVRHDAKEMYLYVLTTNFGAVSSKFVVRTCRYSALTFCRTLLTAPFLVPWPYKWAARLY